MAEYYDEITEKFIDLKNDLDWIILIYKYLIKFYNVHKNNFYFKEYDENSITFEILKWLKNIKEFTMVVTVNSNPRTDNTEIKGYYDLKFESSQWNNGQSHFAIENKILENTETSMKNYTYYPNKSKGKDMEVFDDGGMFRFLSNKYAENQPYGGMLAFIRQKEITQLKHNLKNKIKKLQIENLDTTYGQLIDKNLLELNILDFENSFQSNHIRKDGTTIHLFHVLFIFK